MFRIEQFLPARLHIAGLRIAHRLRVRWWRLSGSAVRGCRVLVLDIDDRVLLIRHSYDAGRWMLPGGGLARGEAPVSAAAREVCEETGCLLKPVAQLFRIDDPASQHETWLVAGWTADGPVADGREIVEARFYPADALPEPLGRGLAERLPEWITAATAVRPAD